MWSVSIERGEPGVTGWRAFLGAESGAATLDWLAVAAGGVIATVLVVTMVGDDAIGVVHEMNDRDAAHEAAVAAVAEREKRRAFEKSAAEPLRHYYPDAPAVDLGVASPATVGDATAPSLAVDTRGSGGGAFEPAIAEPEVVKTAAMSPTVPGFEVTVTDTAPLLPLDEDAVEADASCIEAVRANPFVSESLVATAGCDAADGPVLSEPSRTDGAIGGLGVSTVIVDQAPAFEFEVPEAMAGCDPAVADNPFLSDSLRAAAGCSVGAVTH